MTTSAPDSGAPIRISGITKRYGGSTALEDVNLDVRGGEFLTLLGASGSGKSTLLNILAGFLRPTSGTVEVDGTNITKVPPHKRGLGMVFQHYALFPHMTVAENVAFPLKRQKAPKATIAARVQEALDVVELGHLGSRKPSELSGGQQQRVAFARAIVFRPRVLLMDEPLGALDKLLREQLQLEIRRLHSELGITFVFVTHDQDEALTMSDRIVLLRDGRIVQIGTPQDLYGAPNCLYTAEFVGASNVLSGPVDGVLLQDRITGSTLRLLSPAVEKHASVLLRPERLEIATRAAEVPSGCDSVEVIVEDALYLGSSRRVQLRTRAGGTLVASIDVPRRPDSVTPGAAVHAYWRQEDLVTLQDNAASPVTSTRTGASR